MTWTLKYSAKTHVNAVRNKDSLTQFSRVDCNNVIQEVDITRMSTSRHSTSFLVHMKTWDNVTSLPDTSLLIITALQTTTLTSKGLCQIARGQWQGGSSVCWTVQSTAESKSSHFSGCDINRSNTLLGFNVITIVVFADVSRTKEQRPRMGSLGANYGSCVSTFYWRTEKMCSLRHFNILFASVVVTNMMCVFQRSVGSLVVNQLDRVVRQPVRLHVAGTEEDGWSICTSALS